MLDFNTISEGFEIPELTKDEVTQVQLIRYAGASGDFNQIHTVPEYAKEAGLDGTIAHGMLIMGMIGQMITNFAGVKNVTKFGVSFKNMTKPGEKIKVVGTVKKIYEKDGVQLADCAVQAQGMDGEVKVDGKFTVKA